MIRTFIGVRVAPKTGDALEQWIEKIRPSVDVKRWYNHDQFHITIHFLGNLNGQQIKQIDEICTQALEHISAFTLSLRSIGVFERSKVIWAGVEGDIPVMQDIYKRLWPILEVAGCEKGARPKLAAHITLGRLKTIPTQQELQHLNELVAAMDESFKAFYTWQVTQLERFESVSTTTGVQYPIRAAYPFRACSKSG